MVKPHNIIHDFHLSLCHHLHVTFSIENFSATTITLHSIKVCPTAKVCPAVLRLSVPTCSTQLPQVLVPFSSLPKMSPSKKTLLRRPGRGQARHSHSKKMSNGAVSSFFSKHFDNLLVDLVSTWEKIRTLHATHVQAGTKPILTSFYVPFVGYCLVNTSKVLTNLTLFFHTVLPFTSSNFHVVFPLSCPFPSFQAAEPFECLHKVRDKCSRSPV